MKPLHSPKRIILHTAAFRGKADASIIDKWHKAPPHNFTKIGYHYVVTGSMFDDEAGVELGRSITYQGAHARFNNNNSIGICVTGHGDHIEWTEAQLSWLAILVIDLMYWYNIPISRVIGHRDTWWEKLKRYKTCPGTLINMEEVRKYILSFNAALWNERHKVEKLVWR